MAIPTQPNNAETSAALRKAAQRYHAAHRKMDEARPYGHRNHLYRAAAAEVRAARALLHQATVAAVEAGVAQADAARAAGLSCAQVCRLMRGSASGRKPPPPAPIVRLKEKLPVQQIIDRYVAGESASRLGEEFGCSHSSILALLKKHGVERRRGRTVVLPVPNEELARRYLVDRAQLQDLAAEFGVHSTLISRRLADAGVRVPLGARRLDLPDAEIVSRYRQGETLQQLAAAYNVSTPAIARRVHEDRSRRSTPGSEAARA